MNNIFCYGYKNIFYSKLIILKVIKIGLICLIAVICIIIFLFRKHIIDDTNGQQIQLGQGKSELFAS